jgi:hypothetical protein
MYLRTAISSRSSLSRHSALQSGCISVAPAVLFDLAEPQASGYAAAPRALHRDAPLPGDEGVLLIWRNHRHQDTPLLPARRTGVRRFQETRASLKGWVFREAPACHLPFQASGRPNSPFYPRGRRGSSQGWIFWQAPACHLPFQPSGRPDSPFSPCGRRGQGG